MGQFTRKLRPRDATKRGGFSSSVVEKIKKAITKLTELKDYQRRNVFVYDISKYVGVMANQE